MFQGWLVGQWFPWYTLMQSPLYTLGSNVVSLRLGLLNV